MTTLKNIAVAVASMVIFTNITNAQTVKASYSANYEEPIAIKYLGNDGDYLLFRVSLQAPVSGSTYFEITDKTEGELYSSNLAANFKVQTIKIEKKDDQELSFKLVVGKRTFSKSFSVNTSTVETTTVSENDITRL
jgi:hypothetical protein